MVTEITRLRKAAPELTGAELDREILDLFRRRKDELDVDFRTFRRTLAEAFAAFEIGNSTRINAS